MPESYYRTGQAAKRLGVSSYHIRRLCEVGEVTAEITSGQQWKIPVTEVDRLRREGVPPIPAEIEDEEPEPSEEEYDEPEAAEYASSSPRVIEAAEEVKIVESRLQRRRLEREAEEVEDWFRDRERRQASEETAQRQRREAAAAEQRRQQCVHQWTQYALRSLPYGTPKETELEVHAVVQEALRQGGAGQPEELTRRLVNAAVAKALRPLKRRQEVERALTSAMNRLPWDLQRGADRAPLKQKAWEAAVAAVRRVREEAEYSEMETAATQAVQPMIREHEHRQACQRVLAYLYLSGGPNDEESAAAKEGVRKALAELPIGATSAQMERTKETALAPFVAAVARRKERERLVAEEDSRRRSAASKADLQLDHIARHLEQACEFEEGYLGKWKEVERLRPLIREILIEELLENPDWSAQEIRESIEDHIDDGV